MANRRSRFFARVTVEKRRLVRSTNGRHCPRPDPGCTVHFREWLAEAEPGDAFVYHVGYLHADREAHTTIGASAHALARMVAMACESGKVMLAQRRLDAYRCEYIAVRLDHHRIAKEIALNGLRDIR